MKKLNKKDYIFRGLEEQELQKLPGQIDGQSFLCKQLKNCQVYLCDHISTIYVLNCENSQIYLGPVKTSIFVRNCKNCTISCAAQQVRVSDSENIQIYGFSKTDFTIEKCVDLKIAPYNFRYQGLEQHFEKSGLDYNLENRMFRVMDFTPKENSYQVMNIEDFKGYVDKDLNVEGDLQNPVKWPKYFGGELDYDVFKKLDCEDVQTMMNPNQNKQKIQIDNNKKEKNEIQNNQQQNEPLNKIDKLKQEMNQRYQQKLQILREQNLQEMQQKKQKIQIALQQKQEFMEKYKQKINKKQQLKNVDENQSFENVSQQSNWNVIKENISMKVSDQKGYKDLSTFRRCLQNKFEDDNNQIIQQYQ